MIGGGGGGTSGLPIESGGTSDQDGLDGFSRTMSELDAAASSELESKRNSRRDFAAPSGAAKYSLFSSIGVGLQLLSRKMERGRLGLGGMGAGGDERPVGALSMGRK